MRKKIGLLLTLMSIFSLTACSEVAAEPVTIDGFTISSTTEQFIDQGDYAFTDEELTEFLPDLNRDVPDQVFTFYLELVDVDLDVEDAEVNEAFIPLLEADVVVMDTVGTATFAPITFYDAGRYTFKISQLSTDIAEGWVADSATFYLDVIVSENEEEGVLYASVEQPEIIEFTNAFTLYVEEMLTTLFNSIGFRMSSEYALLINLTTGEILFDHRADVRTYPASVTKIMTVLIGLEQGEMEETVTVNADFNQLFIAQASQSGFVYGETRTYSEILHAIMLESGGEATEALANHVAGSYEAFVELMNLKARQLGMNDTHFVTATGLHDDFHVTTANDIAILLKYALDIPEFREMFTRESYELETPNSITDTLQSTLFRFALTTEFEGGEILGGRTGFTTPAGLCLASLATNGDEEFILITFGASVTDEHRIAHILDALMIYEYFLHEN